MNAMPVIIGLAVGIAVGAMDFSLARSISSLVRPANARLTMGIMVTGFMFRLGAIAFLLWTLSRASNVNFLAVCVGLTGAFTVLALLHAFRTLGGGVRVRKQLSDRR